MVRSERRNLEVTFSSSVSSELLQRIVGRRADCVSDVSEHEKLHNKHHSKACK